jgi:hypothetical protein
LRSWSPSSSAPARWRAPPSGRKRSAQTRLRRRPAGKRLLSRGSARSAFVVGLLLSFPGASYLASLAAIERQNLGDAAIVVTVVAVTAVMLILLEVPLLSYIVAPEWTLAAIERAKGWLSLHGARVAVIAASAIGVLLIARGTAGLLA